MSLINIVSAVGNNSSVYPLIVRDCGIEIPIKTTLTYNQNLKESKDTAKNALRERLIDEYGTSAVWLGGIPLIDLLCDKAIKKAGFNPKINPKLFKETCEQGIKFNIERFKNIAPNEVKDLEKVLNNRKKYEKLLGIKFLLSTIIPIAVMGFILPKLNFALTKKLREKKSDNINNEKSINLKGLSNLSTVNKMAITDGGLTIGRVTTARNKFEKAEMAFKMGGMMFLNFVTPIWIAKLLDKMSSKIFKINVDLDPKMLADKEFIELIQKSDFSIPKKDFISYLDTKPNSDFAKLAQKYCGVKYLKNGVRDPRVYLDVDKITKFANEIEEVRGLALKSSDPKKYLKRAVALKSANIMTNVVISSLLLAVGLPKLTFYLRKKVTGSDAEPGLVVN